MKKFFAGFIALVLIISISPEARANQSNPELSIRDDIRRYSDGSVHFLGLGISVKRERMKGAVISLSDSKDSNSTLSIALYLRSAILKTGSDTKLLTAKSTGPLSAHATLRENFIIEVHDSTQADKRSLIFPNGDVFVREGTEPTVIFAGGPNELAAVDLTLPPRILQFLAGLSLGSNTSFTSVAKTNYVSINSYLTRDEYPRGSMLPYNNPALWDDSARLQGDYEEFCFTDPCCCEETENGSSSGGISDSSEVVSDEDSQEQVSCNLEKAPKTLVLMIHGYDDENFMFFPMALDESKCLFPVRIRWSERECISDVAQKAVDAMKGMCEVCPWCDIQVLGHSSGGLAAALAAAGYRNKEDQKNLPKTLADVCKGQNINVQTFAAPLNAGNGGILSPAANAASSTGLANKAEGCFVSELLSGVKPFGTPDPKVKVVHHKSRKSVGAFKALTDDGILPNGWQDGNDVPGATTKEHPDSTHKGIIHDWGRSNIKKCDCTEDDPDGGSGNPDEGSTYSDETMLELEQLFHAP